MQFYKVREKIFSDKSCWIKKNIIKKVSKYGKQ